MADSGGNTPPGTESHAGSGQDKTKAKATEEISQTANLPPPDQTASGSSSAKNPPGQSRDASSKLAESASDSVQKDSIKNKNKDSMESRGQTEPTLHTDKKQGRFVKGVAQNFEQKHNSEQKEGEHIEEKQLKGKSTKTEIKSGLQKDNSKAEAFADKQDSKKEKLEICTDGKKDLVEEKRSDEKVVKQNKDQHLTGADGQQAQMSHTDTCGETTVEYKGLKTEDLGASFVLVSHLQSENGNTTEVDNDRGMSDNSTRALDFSKSRLQEKTQSPYEKEEVNEDKVEQHASSKSPTVKSEFMRKHQDHSNDIVDNAAASSQKLGESNEHKANDKDKNDLEDEKEHKKESMQPTDHASVTPKEDFKKTAEDKGGSKHDDSAGMQIYVTKPNKEKIPLAVQRKYSVAKIKAMMKDESEMFPDNWYLCFDRVKLEDENKTLADYNIQNGSSLIVLLPRNKGKKDQSAERDGVSTLEGQEPKTECHIQRGEQPTEGEQDDSDGEEKLKFQNNFDESTGNPLQITRELVNSEQILEGLDLELECCVSKPDLKAEWSKDGHLLEVSEIIKQKSSGLVHSLVIGEVSVKDSGEYSVRIEGVKSTSTVTVKEKPVTFSLPLKETVEAEPGKAVRLKCIVSKQDLKAEWTFGDKPVPRSERIRLLSSGMEHSLSIRNVVLEDAGEYCVQVGDAQGKTILNVLEKPVIFSLPLEETVEAEPGKAVCLKCIVSKQGLKAEWTFGDKPVPRSERSRVLSSGMEHSLSIRNVVIEDAGEYCVQVGDAQGKTILNVLDKPSAPKNLTVGDITSGSCKLCWETPENDGGSSIIEYIVQGREVNATGHTESTCSTTECTINSLKEGTQYMFHVAARNKIGTGKFTAIIKLETKWTYDDENTVTVKVGDSMLFQVPFSGAKPSVSLMHNDDRVQNMERIEAEIIDNYVYYRLKVVDRADQGNYTLTVENDTGKGTVVKTLTVQDKPSAPKNLTISDITSDSCHLHWEKPDHENGSPITKYIVQISENSEKDWKEAGSSTTTDMVIYKLQRKTQYRFRVAAQNIVGIGAFMELPAPKAIKDSSASQSVDDSQSSLCPHLERANINPGKNSSKTVCLESDTEKKSTNLKVRSYVPEQERMLLPEVNLSDTAKTFEKEQKSTGKEQNVAGVDSRNGDNDIEDSALEQLANDGNSTKDTSETSEVMKPNVFGKERIQQLFKERWENEFRNVQIEESRSGTELCIKLKGPKTEVEKAKKYVYGYPCYEISFTDVTNRDRFQDMSLLLQEFFQLEYSNDQDLVLDINKQTGKIGICSFLPDKASNATQKIKKCIKIKDLMIETSAWKNEDHLVDVLNATISQRDKPFICIFKCQGVFKVCGLRRYTDLYLPKLEEAVADLSKSDFNKRQEAVQGIQMSPDLYNKEREVISRTVQIHNPLVYDFICKKGHSISENENLQVFPLKNQSNQGFLLKGQSENVEKAEKTLNALATDVEIWMFYVELLTGDMKFGEMAHEIERESDVVFERRDLGDGAKLLKENDNVCFVLPRGHQIQLMGTCRSKKKACISFFETSREDDTGQAWRNTSENNFIVYVPIWESGQKQEKESVRRRFQLCLDQCFKTFQHIDLTISKMSSWKSGKFVKPLLVQLKGALEKDTPRISVCFCCTDYCTRGEIYIAVKDALKRQPSVDSKAQGFGRSNHGLFLSVKRGSLADTKADILVNTIQSNGDLNNGEVAKSLLKKAGHVLQTEVSKKGPFESWNICVTSGGNIGCKYVFHVVLGTYEKESDPKKKLTWLVHKCLQKAADLEVKSIAFPALGAGGLCYPCEEVIEAMYQGVDDFELSHKNRKCLEEVKFVLYKEDIYKMYRYERNMRGFTATEVSCRFPFGKVSFHAEKGVLLNADKDCILYLWEKDVFRRAWRDKHALLKELDHSAFVEWTNNRDRNTMTFLTSAGKNFDCEKIVHVVCHYDDQAKIQGLISGFRFARKLGLTSVAIVFDTSDPLFKSTERLVNAVLSAVSDFAPHTKNEMELALVVPNPYFDRVSCILHENRQSTSSGNQTATDALLKVVGLRQDVHHAIERLKKVEGISFAEVHFPQQEKMTVQTKPALSYTTTMEPGDMSISRGETAPKLGIEEDVLKWSKELLEEVNDMKTYVEVQNIPSDMTQDQLQLMMYKQGFPIAPPVLVYRKGFKTALLICNTAEDASRLSVYRKSQFHFKHLNRKVMSSFTSNIDAEVWNAAKKRNRDRDILDKFKAIHVTIDENRPFEMKAFTSYQIECAKAIEAMFAVELLDTVSTDRNVSGRNSFTVYETDVIENISQQVWYILEAHCCDEIEQFEMDFGKIKFESGKITLPPYEGEIPTCLAKKLRQLASELSEKEIMEIQIDTEKPEMFPQWCKEVEGAIGRSCCVWNEKEKMVLAFGNTYEENLSVKHQLSLKSGKVKPRNRKPVTKPQEGDTGYSSMQYVPEKPKPKNFIWERDAKNRETFETSEGILVNVYNANILNLPVDCIVNAANENLRHGGGVAYVIAKAAGIELTRQGNQLIRENGHLRVGQACATTAGNLDYECVIHTVGPAWSDYSPHAIEDVKKCEKDLYNAIFNSLKEAERRKLKSIALPAVSSAIFGVPEELCVHQYAKATLDYSKQSVHEQDRLTEIHFIDIKENIVRKIQTAFKSFLEGNRRPVYDRNDFVQNRRVTRAWGRNANKTSTQSRSTPTSTTPNLSLPEPLTYEDDWKNQVFLFAGNDGSDMLSICYGDIFESKGSAIVVPRDRNGTSGAIGTGIYNRVPKGLQHLFNSNLTKCLGYSPKVGDVILSDGYSCGFAKLLNVIYPRGTQKRPKDERRKDLMNAYNNILQRASEETKIHSVVMTFFGIDPTIDEELRLCTDAFLHSYLGYCKRRLLHDERSPLDVKVVCRTEYAFDIVCGVLNTYAQSRKKEHEEKQHETGYAAQGTALAEDTDKEFNADNELEKCVICIDNIVDPKTLPCGHKFCSSCIDQHFTFQKKCPTCGAVCGEITGDQPDGKMTFRRDKYQYLCGYENFGTIMITYSFHSGKQEKYHPKPGQFYKGITRVAYLPDNEEGNKILEMLKIAFSRKLVFTIGSSRTTGHDGVITWNDIHHKTDLRPNTQFGYPDVTYLSRVKEELAAKGVTEEDIPQKL